MPPSGPAALLAAARDRDPARPLLTHYDDATGERVELSATTLDNWVAKTANLLQDEFDIGPGSTVAVALPVHWQTAAVLLGIWSCGATVVDTAAEDDGRLTGVDVVLAAQDRLPALEDAGIEELLGLSLHPLGMGMADYTGTARDFAVEVRTHGDVFFPYDSPDPAGPRPRRRRAGADPGWADRRRGRARRRGWGSSPGTASWSTSGRRSRRARWPGCWHHSPRAPRSCCAATRAPTRLPDRAATERVTATLGCRIEGVRELGRGT